MSVIGICIGEGEATPLTRGDRRIVIYALGRLILRSKNTPILANLKAIGGSVFIFRKQ